MCTNGSGRGNDLPITSGMGPSLGRPRSRAFSVRTRILAAVVIPLVVVSALVLRVAADRRALAGDIGELRARSEVLAHLAALRDRVFDERRQFETVARSADLGVSPEAVSALLGMEVVADPTAARDATDEAIRRLAPSDRPFSVSVLDSLRRDLDAGSLATDEASARFASLESLAVAGLEATLDDVSERAVSIGNVALEARVRMMRDAVRVVGSRGGQVQALSSYWFAGEGDAVPALVELARATAQYEQLGRSLESAPVVSVAAAWARPTGVGRAFDEAIAKELSGGASGRPGADTGSVDLREVGRVLGDGLSDYAAIGPIPELASRAVADAATERAAEAASDARQALASGLIAVALALLTAVWFGRSITKPLGLLADQAQRVRAGDLRIPPLSLGGPPELVVASAAFNDVTENLVLMEEKALALSACDFDSPALSRALPGRLGDALHESLQVLSGSILERQHLQARLLHQATHDSLTGLANRPAVIDALGGAVERSRRSGHQVAVSFIDLDDFKATNDTCGHAVGDALLRAVAERMQSAARRGDVVARLGGDEFVLVAEDVEGPEEAVALVRRILAAVAAPIELDGRELTITGSAGIVLNHGGGDDPLTLLAKADLAVYRAKLRATSAIELYDEELQSILRARSDIEGALAATLLAGGDELAVHFQPILDATTGKVVSLEALVRWDRPGVGVVAPDVFIPIAERSDLIVRLDQWVLCTATRQMMAWADHPALRGITLAVNISGRHVTDGRFVENVDSALRASGVAPDRLVLEVTETAFVTDMARAAAQLEQVRSLGVRIAVDDFGTGHTGLTHIRALTVDEIKIDRTFTAELPEVSDLVKIVLDLARHLGVSTVAEGVETVEQAASLRALGCASLQGYLFSPALSPEALVDWLVERQIEALGREVVAMAVLGAPIATTQSGPDGPWQWSEAPS